LKENASCGGLEKYSLKLQTTANTNTFARFYDLSPWTKP